MCKSKSKKATKKKSKSKARKSNAGRPSKFNDCKDIIIKHVRAGNYVETAANAAGICDRTIHNWLKEGKLGESEEKVEFLRAVRNARAEAELEDIQKITEEGGWKGRAWRRERIDYKKWGRKNPDKNMIEPEEVDTLVRNIILAINRTITDKGERSALAEEIARMGTETKIKSKGKKGKKGNDNSGS